MRVARALISAAVLATALALVPGAAANLVGVYRNPMESKGQLGQIRKLSGERCGRGATAHAFRITVGKQTRECSYRTPVIGRDLEIAATMRLLSGSGASKGTMRSAFLGLELRSGDGARYQLAVYPLQRKAQLRKIHDDGSVEYLDIEKGVQGIGGADSANQLRLRAFNVTEGPEKGDCRILAFVGRQKVAEAVDTGAGQLRGRFSGFSLGSAKFAKGAQATVDDVVIRLPGPF